jgi:hypothetical protein
MDFAFGNDFAGPIVVQIWSSITLAAHDEFMQVGVGPSHCDLQDAMKLLERGLAGEFNTPPNRRLDIQQRYVNAENDHAAPAAISV